MAAQKDMNERARELQGQRRQLVINEVQFEIDDIKLAIEKLREATSPHISIESFSPIKRTFVNGAGKVIHEDAGLDWGNRKDTLTKKDISRLEYKLACLLQKKYNEASDKNKEEQIRDIPSNLKGRLLPLFVRRYNTLSPEAKKKQIDEVFDEVLTKLTLNVEENNPLSSLVSQLKTDITTFKEVLKAEVDAPQKNGWLKSPNPMETALELHDAVYKLLDKEINFDEKYSVIFRFYRGATGYGTAIQCGPAISALHYSILIGLTMFCALLLIGATIMFFASPPLFIAAGFLPILCAISGGISLFTSISSYAIQAYHNFPLSGGDMATRGKVVHDDLRALAHEIGGQYSIFGNFFQKIPVQFRKNSEEILLEERDPHQEQCVVFD